MREAAGRAGIELILPTIEAPYWREDEYRAAFTRMAEESVDGIVVATMVENWTYRRLIITLGRVPAASNLPGPHLRRTWWDDKFWTG